MFDSSHPCQPGASRAQAPIAQLAEHLLKKRGYRWNAVDKAWVLNTTADREQEEKVSLHRAGISDKNIKTSTDAGVIVRLQTFARVFGVPYEERGFVKALGFYWNASRKCWETVVSEKGLSWDAHERLLHHFGDSIRIRVR